jgi:hypothetical protein
MRLGIVFGVALVSLPLGAHALELRSEAIASNDFAFVTGDFESEFFDEQLALGGGITMISDFHFQRYGAQGMAEYRGEHFSAGLSGSFAPQQDRRGWATLNPHAALQLTIDRWVLRGATGVLLRQVDALVRHVPLPIEQLQLQAEIAAELPNSWEVGVEALASFYNPDLSRSQFHGAELGLAVSVGGRPEQWAVTGHIARRIVRGLSAEIGFGGVGYADRVGSAVTPKAALSGGPWKRLSIKATLEMVVGVGAARAEPLREIGSIEIGFAQ